MSFRLLLVSFDTQRPTNSCCFSFRSTRRPAGGCTTKNAMMRLAAVSCAYPPSVPSSRFWRLTELRYDCVILLFIHARTRKVASQDTQCLLPGPDWLNRCCNASSSLEVRRKFTIAYSTLVWMLAGP
jgi:hypothetical protein